MQFHMIRHLMLPAGAACALTGCKTWERQPLNLDQHRSAWLERTADAEPVADVARLFEARGEHAAQFNPADGITLPEAELIALVYNPDLRLARARAAVAIATAEHAGLWDDPHLDFDLMRAAESVPDPWVVGVNLGFTIPLSGRLDAEVDHADAAVDAALYQIVEAEWQARITLRETWASWSAGRLRLEQTTAIIVRLESLAASIGELADAGEIARPEATLFAIDLAQKRADLIELRSALASAELRIRALMGLSPAAPLELIPQFEPIVPEPGDIPADAPALAQLAAEYEVAEQELRREILKQYPDLTLGPAFEADEGQSKIGIFGGIPIPLWNANRQAIAEAQAQRELARAVYETRYEQLSAQLAAARARFQAAQQRRQEIESTIAPLVDQQIEDARQLIELGEGSALVLLESLARAHDTRLQLIDLHLDALLAAIEIEFLTGATAALPFTHIEGRMEGQQ